MVGFTIETTFFLFSDGSLDVTLTTWEGGEATLPVSHLVSFVDYLRATDCPMPDPLPAVRVSAPTDAEGE
ncbi:MAG TPA: hypothetical protein DD490_11205 [Acidobacteria bacterium]|nr:hypothetical protein [Acidobacteriota bacterium]